MMINLDANLDDVETEEKRGPMPVADYYVVVEKAEELTSQAGNAMIKLTFKLTGNPKYDGKLLWRYIVFGLDHSLEQLKRDMTCLGMNTSNITAVSADMFTRMRCRVHTKHEKYEGELQDKIHYLKPYESDNPDMPEPVTSDDDPDNGDDNPF